MKILTLWLPVLLGLVSVGCSGEDPWMNDAACPSSPYSPIDETSTNPSFFAACLGEGIRCRYGTVTCEDGTLFQSDTLRCINGAVSHQVGRFCPDDSGSLCGKRGDLGNNVGVGAFISLGCLVQGTSPDLLDVQAREIRGQETSFCTKVCLNDSECGEDAICLEDALKGNSVCVPNSCLADLGI